MFSSRLLTIRDKIEWLSLIEKCESSDPHYLPSYIGLYEKMEDGESKRHFGGEAFAFVFGDHQNYIFYPFLKRAITGLISNESRPLFDVTSVYGYGGPLACGTNQENAQLWTGFFDAFHDYCIQNDIVSEFSRLNPMGENHKPVLTYSTGLIKKRGRVVYFDLTHSEEEMLSGMNQSRRSCIRKMLQDTNYEFSASTNPDDATIFFPLYTMTMARNEAEEKYYFPQSFFNSLFEAMSRHWSFDYIKYQGTLCSASLILAHNKVAYLYLQASRTDLLDSHSNELLIYNSAIRLKNLGYHALVLGGGVSSSEDSLYVYKSRFSPFARDFYTYHKIHLTEEYDNLVESRKTLAGDIEPDFFPAYRSS